MTWLGEDDLLKIGSIEEEEERGREGIGPAKRLGVVCAFEGVEKIELFLGLRLNLTLAKRWWIAPQGQWQYSCSAPEGGARSTDNKRVTPLEKRERKIRGGLGGSADDGIG